MNSDIESVFKRVAPIAERLNAEYLQARNNAFRAVRHEIDDLLDHSEIELNNSRNTWSNNGIDEHFLEVKCSLYKLLLELLEENRRAS